MYIGGESRLVFQLFLGLSFSLIFMPNAENSLTNYRYNLLAFINSWNALPQELGVKKLLCLPWICLECKLR